MSAKGKQIVYRLGVQVPTDGAQIKDIPLPWENSQIDAARRAFLDRHPLAKNKEQVALAKGEGMMLRLQSHMLNSKGLCLCQQAALTLTCGFLCRHPWVHA